MSAGIHDETTWADVRALAAWGAICRLALHAPRGRFSREGGAGPPRVLIADDYQDAAESLSLLLRTMGARTDIALDGKQALAIASRWQPEVCVLDLQMPGLDGRDVARQIRAQSWDERPLLIALTGWTTEHDRSSALQAGFDHYVTKPVEPAWLMRVIETYCRTRR